jgi:hypothetical protein
MDVNNNNIDAQTKRIYTQYVLKDGTEFLATERGEVIAKKDSTSSFYKPVTSRTGILGSVEDTFPEESATYSASPKIGQILLLGKLFTTTGENQIIEINKMNYFRSSLFKEKQYK